jgi:hypothetical protein
MTCLGLMVALVGKLLALVILGPIVLLILLVVLVKKLL